MALAEPEGYVRIFVDEGEAMRSLIEKQSRNRDHLLSGYTDKLLAAFTQPVAAPKSEFMHQKSGIPEPLSERELEVLKLLRSELSGPEIAGQLIVSLNTLRTHTKNIYQQTGGQQPPGGHPPRRGTRFILAGPKIPTPAPAGVTNHLLGLFCFPPSITTSITSCGDDISPPPAVSYGQINHERKT